MKNKIQKINIKNIINIDTAVTSDSGDLVFQKINETIKSGHIAEVDFADISIMTTAFLNAAIGQLYSVYNSEQLKKAIKIINVTEEDIILFVRVVKRAKEYFVNKNGFEGSANKAMYGS